MSSLISVYRSLRNGVQFENDLKSAIWYASKNVNSGVCINPKKLTITIREIIVRDNENCSYFFQKKSYSEYALTQDISNIDISKPFVVVEVNSKTDGNYYVYLCTA